MKVFKRQTLPACRAQNPSLHKCNRRLPKPHKSHLSLHQKAIKRQKLGHVIEWNSDENVFETHLIDSTEAQVRLVLRKIEF